MVNVDYEFIVKHGCYMGNTTKDTTCDAQALYREARIAEVVDQKLDCSGYGDGKPSNSPDGNIEAKAMIGANETQQYLFKILGWFPWDDDEILE